LFVSRARTRDIAFYVIDQFRKLSTGRSVPSYFLPELYSMSSEDIAEEIRTSFPGTEEVIVQYLGGYLVDDAGEEEDVLQVAHDILKSVAGDRDDILEKLMLKLGDTLEEQLNSRLKNKSRPKLQKLDKVMDMSKSHLSNTIALSEGVDLESINKGK